MTVELVRLLFLVVTAISTYAIDESYGVPVSSDRCADESYETTYEITEVNDILPASRGLPSLPPSPREFAQKSALRSQASASQLSDRRRSTPALSCADYVNTEMYASFFGDVQDAMILEQSPPHSYSHNFESSTTPFSRSLASLDLAQMRTQYEPLVIARSPSSTGYVANSGNFIINQ